MIRRPPRSTRMTHSFPTRRSSDRGELLGAAILWDQLELGGWIARRFRLGLLHKCLRLMLVRGESRSEEHTSELQSLMRNSYAVFCLKKKKPTVVQQQRHTVNNKYTQKTTSTTSTKQNTYTA